MKRREPIPLADVITSSGVFSSSAARWKAVVERSVAAIGNFVYAVRTTGVYCVPGCASRRPKRESVEFFDHPLLAEMAGFRPCLRCRPADADRIDPSVARMIQACRLIQDSRRPPAVEDIASLLGVSRQHLHRMFLRHLHVTPRAYATAIRVQRLRRECGRAPTPPRSVGHRRKGDIVSIGYAIAPCSLGRMLVAATPKGICWISLGDDEAELRAEFVRQFPHAAPADSRLALRLARAVRALDSHAADCRLPLDIRGTAFQARVWNALRAIPAGDSFSYAEIAAAIDQPRAVRAVASACAANPIAIAIPCHRAVRADGGDGGYRWGTKRKSELLRRERSATRLRTRDDR